MKEFADFLNEKEEELKAMFEEWQGEEISAENFSFLIFQAAQKLRENQDDANRELLKKVKRVL